MEAYYKTFEELMGVNLPQLADHLHSIGVTPDLYVLDWLLTVFARPLPLDAAVRIWDVYLRDGEEFLLRAAIGQCCYFLYIFGEGLYVSGVDFIVFFNAVLQLSTSTG